MYRFLSRTVCSARSPSLCVYESCPAKCETVSRVLGGVGVNALSTGSFRLCEKKDPSDRGETTKAEKESRTNATGSEAELALKVDDGGTAHQQVSAKPEQVKAAQSGKESLLGLLGAMKVEVTSKKKLKNLKLKQSFESAIKYQSKPAAMESTISMFQKVTEETSSRSETLDPKLVAAASAAASTLPDSSQAESELLKQLRQRKALTEAQRKGNDIGVIIADMKVGKRSGRQKAWPADQIQFDDDGRGYTHVRGITGELAKVGKRRNLFPAKRLNIFSPAPDQTMAELAVAKPTLWDIEFANELSLVTNRSPRNQFEEMIQWTREGKLWEYPVNNETGLEEEAAVPFHEHVFLEKHLEEGFPDRGPVRHFMELVVAGLSRNPYMTVQQKKEHIAWFRDYFHQKEEVLNEADVYLS